MVHIYHLYDKKIKAPVYVGATKNIKMRFSNHLITTLKEYVNKDAVCLEVLESVEQIKAADAELFWLNKYLLKGIKLLNATRKRYPVRRATHIPQCKNKVIPCKILDKWKILRSAQDSRVLG
jgi:predicted GIY-YIG superfamily endonuclease